MSLQCLKINGQSSTLLHGTCLISGAKNAALPMMAAALLTSEPLCLENVPHLKDITTMCRLLNTLGVELCMHDDGRLSLQASTLSAHCAPYHLVRTMRASFLLLGPLLARCGQAKVSLPGGCAIGSRPVEWHLEALRALGAEIEMDNGYVCARAPNGLHGGHIVFPQVTVTGTENALMAACLAKGVTRIEGASIEPEVTDLIECLQRMGADITGKGTATLVITGVNALHGATHRIIPDRIEAGTFLIAAAMSRGSVTLKGVCPSHLTCVLAHLRDAGADIALHETTIHLNMQGKRPKAISIETAPYPGFPTDLQAQWMVMCTLAEGVAVIKETVFENRFMHVQELARMGAHITLNRQCATVEGQAQLSAAEITATDLRASASLVLAAIMADGLSTLHRVYHIDRGYEHIEDKLMALGAKPMMRVWDDAA